MTRFSGHGTCVGLTPLFDGFLEQSRKIRLPIRGSDKSGSFFSLFEYIAQIPEKSKLYGVAKRYSSHSHGTIC
jgi:hypothetical protein